MTDLYKTPNHAETCNIAMNGEAVEYPAAKPSPSEAGEYGNVKMINVDMIDTDRISETSADVKVGNISAWGSMVMAIEKRVANLYDSHKDTLWRLVKAVMVLAYLSFISYSWYYRFGDEGSITLLVITAFLASYTFRRFLKRRGATARLAHWTRQYCQSWTKCRLYLRYFLYVAAITGLGLYLGLQVIPSNPRNLQALTGIFALVVICFVLSTSPSQVNWHTVFWGFAVQISIAIFTLRTQIGYDIFMWMGNFVQSFMGFSDAGAAFVFGKDFKSWGLFFKVGGVFIFFNTVVTCLTQLGVTEAVVLSAGKLMAACLDTGPVESVMAVASIFLGLTDVPFLARPFLPNLSKSEMCAVMTAGYASVSGGMIGVFIVSGALPNHLLTAAVISAPAALAFSKLIWPETESVKLSTQRGMTMRDKTQEHKVLSSCSEGATVAARVIGVVMANMLAFFSVLAMMNTVLAWLGHRVGVDDLTFETVCGYILYPLAYVMGVHPEDCQDVGALIGIKLFATPMMGFVDLGMRTQNRLTFEEYIQTNGSWHLNGRDVILEATNTTLIKGYMQKRSEAIATYAICGFSAFPALAIAMANFIALCPQRRPEITKIIPKAFFAGNMACFATGAVAGLMYFES